MMKLAPKRRPASARRRAPAAFYLCALTSVLFGGLGAACGGKIDIQGHGAAGGSSSDETSGTPAPSARSSGPAAGSGTTTSGTAGTPASPEAGGSSTACSGDDPSARGANLPVTIDAGRRFSDECGGEAGPSSTIFKVCSVDSDCTLTRVSNCTTDVPVYGVAKAKSSIFNECFPFPNCTAFTGHPGVNTIAENGVGNLTGATISVSCACGLCMSHAQ
jgi:hypothetical protein